MNIAELACKIGCHDTLVALCTALDGGDNDAAADLFTENAVLAMPTGEKRGTEVRETLNGRPASIRTRHIMTNVMVTPHGDNEASAIATIVVYRIPVEDNASHPLPLPATPQAIGEWSIDLSLTSQGWRISRYAASEQMAPPK